MYSWPGQGPSKNLEVRHSQPMPGGREVDGTDLRGAAERIAVSQVDNVGGHRCAVELLTRARAFASAIGPPRTPCRIAFVASWVSTLRHENSLRWCRFGGESRAGNPGRSRRARGVSRAHR